MVLSYACCFSAVTLRIWLPLLIPFFHEINIARSADGTESKWIKESFNALKTLFPSRYARAGKADVYREGGVK